MILPHGGKLVNRIVQRTTNYNNLTLKKLYLNEQEISDLEMLAIGAYSPLEGFMNKNDYESVINNMRLSNGIV